MRAFISYSHKDETFRLELEKHLALLKRQQLIEVWSDHCIRPGEQIDPGIAEALTKAHLVLLLVSADFMHSDYCYGVEMMRSIERQAENTAIVVPIIIRPCDWTSAPFGRLKALPADGKAVTKWPSLDDAFFDVVNHLRALLTRPSKTGLVETANKPYSPALVSQRVTRVPRSSNLYLPKIYTDQDRHDFIVECFEYIQNYFELSLAELQARNRGVSSRLMAGSRNSFTVVLFREGQRQSGCHIRLGSGFGSDNIAYSASENTQENSYNELLSIEAEGHVLLLKATIGMLNRKERQRLTEEGAAEHLWTLFLSPLQN